MSIMCRHPACSREFKNAHGMHIHYGKIHGDITETWDRVTPELADGRTDLREHPQSETVGVVDARFDDRYSFDHIRLMKWFETETQERFQEFRLAKFVDEKSLHPSREWINIPPDYFGEIQNTLLDGEIAAEMING